jgi:uncharacterized membrane protein YdbT with pleckstrin-like domain
MKDLRLLVGQGEKILYEGKPKKICYIFESIFNPLLPFAIIWGLFDFFIIGQAFTNGAEEAGLGIFLIGFFLFHLMPVWLYLGGILFTFRKYRNTNYIVTDRAIYISSGIFAKQYNTKSFAEMSNVNLHRGIFDQMFNVGDVITTSSQRSSEEGVSSMKISSISNYIEVYNLVKKLQQDIYTDVMYPNDMRPSENHGYNTQYKG